MCKRSLFSVASLAVCLCLANPAFAQKGKPAGTAKPHIVNNTADAEFANGNAAYDRKEWDKAINHYSAALRLKADFVPAYFNRGRANLFHGKFDASVADLQKACELAPKAPGAHTWLAAAYLDRGDHAAAILSADSALKLDAKQAFAYYIRGTARIHKGELAKAIDDLNESARLYPNDAMIYNNRGIAYQKLGDEKKAAADFARRDQLNGKTPTETGTGGLTKEQALARVKAAEAQYQQFDKLVEIHERRIRAVQSIRIPPGVPRPRIDPVPQELLQRRAQAWNVLQEAIRVHKQTP